MLKNDLDYTKDAGITNLIVHVKLSHKNIPSPIFSKFNDKAEIDAGLINKLKSLFKVDKLVN